MRNAKVYRLATVRRYMDDIPADLTEMPRLIAHARAHRGGLQTIGDDRVRAILLNRDLKPVGLRVMRDLRVATDRSSFDAFVDTARGRVDGKRRFTAQLVRFSGEVGFEEDDILDLVGIIAESDL